MSHHTRQTSSLVILPSALCPLPSAAPSHPVLDPCRTSSFSWLRAAGAMASSRSISSCPRRKSRTCPNCLGLRSMKYCPSSSGSQAPELIKWKKNVPS